MLMLLIVNTSPQGATEWPSCYHIAGDNNPQAVKRAANNICSLLKKSENKDRWEEYKWFSFPVVLYVNKSISHWCIWLSRSYFPVANVTDLLNLIIFSVNSVWDKRLCPCSSTSLGIPLDIIQWDICNLPLRTGSVDIIVTDMPFGKRWGIASKAAALSCRGRVCLPGQG